MGLARPIVFPKKYVMLLIYLLVAMAIPFDFSSPMNRWTDNIRCGCCLAIALWRRTT
jgi:hypothetical protein